MNWLFAAITGYLLGSLPYGLLLTLAFGAGDVRNIGSGSIGATNVLRTGRKGLAAATVVLDAAKAIAAVLIAAAVWPGTEGVAAVAAIAGHCFPIWLKFKGGKGFASAAGVCSILAWPVFLICGAVWAAMIALMIRETTASYVLVMLLFAMLEGRWRESAGWLFILGVFALVLGLHAHAVAAVVGPLDQVSPGWRGLLGFGYFIDSVKETTLLVLLPLWFDALVVALALFGWAAWNNPVGLRAIVTIAGYAALLGLLARENNIYWGLMIAPIVLLGLLFAPDGLRDLVTRALDRRRITVTRIER